MGWCPIVVTHKLCIDNLESTKQRAVLMLSFKPYGLKTPDKTLQEHRDSSSGTAYRLSMSHHRACDLASSPRHSQILSRSRGEKSGEGLGSLLCHGPEMVDSVST